MKEGDHDNRVVPAGGGGQVHVQAVVLVEWHLAVFRCENRSRMGKKKPPLLVFDNTVAISLDSLLESAINLACVLLELKVQNHVSA